MAEKIVQQVLMWENLNFLDHSGFSMEKILNILKDV